VILAQGSVIVCFGHSPLRGNIFGAKVADDEALCFSALRQQAHVPLNALLKHNCSGEDGYKKTEDGHYEDEHEEHRRARPCRFRADSTFSTLGQNYGAT
jgi:hypothetical protein